MLVYQSNRISPKQIEFVSRDCWNSPFRDDYLHVIYTCNSLIFSVKLADVKIIHFFALFCWQWGKRDVVYSQLQDATNQQTNKQTT